MRAFCLPERWRSVGWDPISGPVTDPAGPATGKVKVEKGGWWGGSIFVAQSAYHHFDGPPEYGDIHIGFRIITP